ncbi:hypothetical protein GCM10011314_03490 [Knoellia flava]|uniref:Uncharacterized protein n=1 Tax=Knoellia flava TaxID=913969 RepID=A0A8H9KP80_9MICO|nr:hypothetical protein GCM10011314_03490 [Knoellia flava]
MAVGAAVAAGDATVVRPVVPPAAVDVVEAAAGEAEAPLSGVAERSVDPAPLHAVVESAATARTVVTVIRRSRVPAVPMMCFPSVVSR